MGFFLLLSSTAMIYGYIRVSTDKQTSENQRFEILKFADELQTCPACSKSFQMPIALSNPSEDPGWPHDPTDQQFQRMLDSWFHFHRAIHIGELIWIALRYLKQNPASRFIAQFDHVLVDEYQDLNRAEQELLDILATTASFTVIGDEDQSIYSFRYAHPEGIHAFGVSHPEAYDTSLLECRRCPPNIVEMANSLISHNEFRSPRTLRSWPGNTSNGDIQIVHGRLWRRKQPG